jgi:O-antigen ligase
MLYALDAEITNARALTMLGAPLMLFTLAQGVRNWRMVDNLILAWLAATILAGLYQLYDWHFGSSLSDLEVGEAGSRFSTTINALSEQDTLGAARRAMGPTSNPAVYGVNLLLVMPFLFYRLQLARGLAAKIFWMLSIALIFYNLLLTNTRAVLIFAVILCLMIVLTGLFKLTVVRVGLSILALVAVIPLLPQSIWDRILNVHAYELDKATNLAWRFDLWEAAVRLGSDHWLSGIGVGNNTALIALLDPTRFDGEWIMAHNEFLQTYTELGIPGLLIFVAMVASLLWKAAVVMRRCSGDPAMARQYWFAAASLCSLAIGPMFALQVDAFHFALKGWWLVAGLVIVADRLTREKSWLREREPAYVR